MVGGRRLPGRSADREGRRRRFGMRVASRGKIFGAGLTALDLVKGPAEETPIQSWTGAHAGTCSRFWRISVGTLTRWRA